MRGTVLGNCYRASVPDFTAVLGDLDDLPLLAVKTCIFDRSGGVADVWVIVRIERQLRGEGAKLLIEHHEEPLGRSGGPKSVLESTSAVGVADVQIRIRVHGQGRKISGQI